MARPKLPSGRVPSDSSLLAAVKAATAVLPRLFRAYCSISEPMAMMLLWKPMGSPMCRWLSTSRRLSLQSERCSRKEGKAL